MAGDARRGGMTAIGLLFFAVCAAVVGVVLGLTGLVLRGRSCAGLARWYVRGLLLVGAVAVVLAVWFVLRAVA
jgi:hypothetical protein